MEKSQLIRKIISIINQTYFIVRVKEFVKRKSQTNRVKNINLNQRLIINLRQSLNQKKNFNEDKCQSKVDFNQKQI